MAQQIVVVGRGEALFAEHIARRFGGVMEDLPRSLARPFRRYRITIPFQSPEQMARVRRNAEVELDGVSVTLEDA